MTPADYEALRDEILSGPRAEQCAPHVLLNRQEGDPKAPSAEVFAKDSAIAAILSAGRTVYASTRLSSLGLASRIADIGALPGPLVSEMILQKIEGFATACLATDGNEAPAVAARLFGAQIKRQMKHLEGAGIDFGDIDMHAMFDRMVAGGGLSEEEAAAMKAVSLADAPVSAADVSRALRGPWE